MTQKYNFVLDKQIKDKNKYIFTVFHYYDEKRENEIGTIKIKVYNYKGANKRPPVIEYMDLKYKKYYEDPILIKEFVNYICLANHDDRIYARTYTTDKNSIIQHGVYLKLGFETIFSYMIYDKKYITLKQNTPDIIINELYFDKYEEEFYCPISSDINELIKMEIEFLKEDYTISKKYDAFTEKEYKESIKRSIKIKSLKQFFREENMIYYYARDIKTNKPIGFVHLLDSSLKPGEFYINSLYVRPEFRKKGIGKALLNKCIQKSFEKNCTDLFINVYIENQPAYNLYKKFGFIDDILTLKADLYNY